MYRIQHMDVFGLLKEAVRLIPALFISVSNKCVVVERKGASICFLLWLMRGTCIIGQWSEIVSSLESLGGEEEALNTINPNCLVGYQQLTKKLSFQEDTHVSLCLLSSEKKNGQCPLGHLVESLYFSRLLKIVLKSTLNISTPAKQKELCWDPKKVFRCSTFTIEVRSGKFIFFLAHPGCSAKACESYFFGHFEASPFRPFWRVLLDPWRPLKTLAGPLGPLWTLEGPYETL